MTTQKTIKFVVVTPEQQVVEETADSIVIPMHDGELGILPGRAPLMCGLGIGQMRYQQAGQTRRVYIDGGFAQVHDNDLTVLTEQAVPAEQITDELVAEAEQKVAEITERTLEAHDARREQQRRAGALRKLHGGR